MTFAPDWTRRSRKEVEFICSDGRARKLPVDACPAPMGDELIAYCEKMVRLESGDGLAVVVAIDGNPV